MLHSRGRCTMRVCNIDSIIVKDQKVFCGTLWVIEVEDAKRAVL